MRWIVSHFFDIVKIAALIVGSVVSSVAVVQRQIADLQQVNAVQDQVIAALRGTVNRLQRDQDEQTKRIERQLDEIKFQLGDIGKSVAVFADRFQYRGGRNNDED